MNSASRSEREDRATEGNRKAPATPATTIVRTSTTTAVTTEAGRDAPCTGEPHNPGSDGSQTAHDLMERIGGQARKMGGYEE